MPIVTTARPQVQEILLPLCYVIDVDLPRSSGAPNFQFGHVRESSIFAATTSLGIIRLVMPWPEENVTRDIWTRPFLQAFQYFVMCSNSSMKASGCIL